ncbi:MAG: DUF1538 family protein [Methanobacteriota archaeon]
MIILIIASYVPHVTILVKEFCDHRNSLGIALSTAGLILFLEGLKLGFLPLGRQVGAGLPITGSPYLVVAFASIFGYAITLAEPNLRVLINQVETVSSGAIQEILLCMRLE